MRIFQAVFAGKKEVVLVRSDDGFNVDGTARPDVRSYLAGGYTQAVHPSLVDAANACDLFGQFVLLKHNHVNRTLTILNDRFGLFPFFIARNRDRLYLCTELNPLVDLLEGGCPDYEAMSDILAFNVPFDRRTKWKSIESLGGGIEMTIDLDTLSINTRKAWDPASFLKAADLRFDDVKDKLVDLYLEGVEQAVGSKEVRVTLSGGADSRCLLAASLHLGKATSTYSTGIEGSRALSYASAMAKKCGVRHHARPLDEHFVEHLPSLMHLASKTMQGMSFSSEVEAMWLREQMDSSGVLLHGACGELYKIGEMHQYPFDSIVASLQGGAVGDHLWKRFGQSYRLRSQGFSSGTQLAMGDFAQQHLRDKIARYSGELDTAGVLQLIYIEEFIGKVVKSSWQMWRQRISTMFPFAYPPLVDLILRVAPKEKAANRFVVHLLKRANRDLGRHPDSNTGVRIGASWLRRESMHVYDYATKRLSFHRRRFDHQDFVTWIARAPGGPESMFAEFNNLTHALDMHHIRQLIHACRAGDEAAARTLFFLWGWSLSCMDSIAGSCRGQGTPQLEASAFPALLPS